MQTNILCRRKFTSRTSQKVRRSLKLESHDEEILNTMAILSPVLKPVSQMQLNSGSVVTIPQISWSEFESILQDLGEERVSCIAYSQNTLEIRVPLPEHEKLKDLISDIVKILLKHSGRKYEPFGSTTFKQENVAGVEPDACVYIQNYQRMIGRRRLQAGDPPPDLAIEIDVASKTTFNTYSAIAVPELWIYGQGELQIYLFESGKYIASSFSPIFPNIPITQIIPETIEKAWTLGWGEALEEFEKNLS
jgi:Uma2 family endonuclease